MLLQYLRSYEVDYDGERMGVNSPLGFCRVNVQLIHIAVYFDRKDCLIELTRPTVFPRPTLMARTGQNDDVFSGDTILTLATKRGSIQCLRYILETLKMDPNLTDEDNFVENGQRLPGKTPLDVACASDNSYAKRFAQLLKRAEANFRNNPPLRSTSASMATESQPGLGSAAASSKSI